MAQHSTVCPEDSLLPPGHASLLQVLENQLATRGPNNLPLVTLGVVGQPPAVGD